jgi:vanillate O-demethylase monooxygenase subunit
VIAMAGRCPHRGYPLELGTRIPGGVQCGYHGLAFDDRGICRTRAHRAVPATMNVATYPVIERGPLVWVWLGDARLADPAALAATPDLGFGNPEWRIDANGYLRVRARHAFVCDNLLDTAHIDFIHARSLERADLAFDDEQRTAQPATVSRHSRGNDAQAFAALLPGLSGPVDVVVSTQFRSPGLIVAVRSQFNRPATNASTPQPIAQMAFVHALTPETDRSTHYFPLFTRDFRIADDAFSAEIGARNMLVAEEDRSAVEAIEASLSLTGETPFDSPLPQDAAAEHARHVIDMLIASEAAPPDERFADR